MTWSDSLVKLATFEVEGHQQRLGEIMQRLAKAEMRLAVLHAEGEAEAERARDDVSSGWYHIGYADGLRARKAAVQADIDLIRIEERGARDALSQAFEEQKKYEQVAESLRLAAVKETNRRETAELDEVGMRAARRR
ncbi:flagellar FliJ family protein [Phenylobacterium sp.]|uniref:flagellar FliJ family protein n=1 Tax=Phenylobacterium sp. TaxID=1871053 RepID=UPI00356278AD